MKKYRYFTFRNYVALNVVEGDMHFVGPICFWKQAKILEIQEAGLEGRPVGGEFTLPLSGADLRLLRESVKPLAVEKSLQELEPLMEEGLIVIGEHESQRRTSFGHRALISPAGNACDVIEAAREAFAKDKDDICQWSWMIQATTKGWEWAKDRKKLIDFAVYNEEDRHFYSSALPNLSD
ncbi:MAG: hypothetical protein RL636_1336 [Verrucomicrobiota bacterium]|jgi:hypothetical protein